MKRTVRTTSTCGKTTSIRPSSSKNYWKLLNKTKLILFEFTIFKLLIIFKLESKDAKVPDLRVWEAVLKLTDNARACQAKTSFAIRPNKEKNYQLNALKTGKDHRGNEQTTQNAENHTNEQIEKTLIISEEKCKQEKKVTR